LLAAVEPSARQSTLPKIVRSMLSRLWKLSGNCGVLGPDVVVASAAAAVGGCGDAVAGTVVTLDVDGWELDSETGT